MDTRKVQELFQKVEKAVSCCVAQSIDVNDLNLTKCCGAALSTEYYAYLVGNGTTTCPHCRGHLSEPLHVPWSTDLLADLRNLRDEIEQPSGGRPPMIDACCQTADPKRSIILAKMMLEKSFPDFTDFLSKTGGCYLTGRDLECLNVLALLSRNVIFERIESTEYLGVKLYRVLYGKNASIFQFGHYAELFGKLGAVAELVIGAALPQPYCRPRRITHKRDSVMYALLWLEPFMVNGNNDVVRSLRESFGLLGTELNVDPTKEHSKKGPCNDCLKCKIQNAVRQEIRHQVLNETTKDYMLQCAQCGDVVDWRMTDGHARKHKGQLYEYCHSCLLPVSGPYASDKLHAVECPFRLFPIGPDAAADQYRRPPQPLSMRSTVRLEYPKGPGPVAVDVSFEEIRGKMVAKFSWI